MGIIVQDARVTGALTKLMDLPQGSRATFGSCRCSRLDVRLDSGARFHLQIRAQARTWALSNQSDFADLYVEDLEDPLQRVICRRRRHDLVLPFEMARVKVEGYPLLIVSAPEPTFLEDLQCSEASLGDLTRSPKEDSVYFLAAVLLCSARLLHGPEAPLINQREIALRLTQLGHVVQPRTVRSYLDYFANRLGIPAQGSPDQVRWWRREILARTVVSQSIVRPEHLRLVEPRA